MNHILLVTLCILLSIHSTYSVVTSCSHGITVSCNNNQVVFARCFEGCHRRHSSYACPAYFGKTLPGGAKYRQNTRGGHMCPGRRKKWRGCNLPTNILPALIPYCTQQGDGEHNADYATDVSPAIVALHQQTVRNGLQASGLTARQQSFGDFMDADEYDQDILDEIYELDELEEELEELEEMDLDHLKKQSKLLSGYRYH